MNKKYLRVKKWAHLGAIAATVLATNVLAQDATIPVYVTNSRDIAATVSITPNGSEGVGATNVNVPAKTETEIHIKLSGGTSILHGQHRMSAPAMMSHSRSGAMLQLQPTAYANAVISLYSVNGKRILSSKASAKSGSLNISRPNISAGVYLLSVKGVNGNSFSSRLTHKGGFLNIRVAFNDALLPHNRQAGVEPAPTWTITAQAVSQYTDIVTGTIVPQAGKNDLITITFSSSGSTIDIPSSMKPKKPNNGSDEILHTCDDYSEHFGDFTPLPAADFTETVGSTSFKMLYVSGGTFSLGSISGVSVSPYFIMETRVSSTLWRAVMGGNGSPTSGTWYDANEFACKLSERTGKRYRLMTEAEFEYAAKNVTLTPPNTNNGFSDHEWAYDSWEAELSTANHGGKDPLGPCGAIHTQKTRRNATTVTGDWKTGREIRSIEGSGHQIRLVVSQNVAYPAGYVPPCLLEAPEQGAEPMNSYRDPRWITDGDSRWTNGPIAISYMNTKVDLRVWEDGTAKWGSTNGQWFTSNNITFVFVPTSGSARRYQYIFVSPNELSLVTDLGHSNSGGFIGRMVKESASNVTKPTVSLAANGEALARAQGADFDKYYKMIDMENIPQSARGKDEKLLDGPSHGWFQNNSSQHASHHYRKDIDQNDFRFSNNISPSRIMLASGSWFTVNNSFLRVTHGSGSSAYTVDYLYAVTSGSTPTLYHNSFVGYERGDFRMFEKTANGGGSSVFPCGSICSGEIPMGNPMRQSNDHSTFVPAKCPPGGCN